MSESESDDCTPEEIKAMALKVTYNLLPEKSKKAYQKSYDTFIRYMESTKKAATFSETVMLAYFEELGNKFAPSTLWTKYSMLKSTINLHHQTDISKYCKLRTMLKRKSEGFRAKKSKTFLPDDIKKFIAEAPDSLYLFSKECPLGVLDEESFKYIFRQFFPLGELTPELRDLMKDTDSITRFEKNADGSLQFIVTKDGKEKYSEKTESCQDVDYTTPEGVKTKLSCQITDTEVKALITYPDGSKYHFDKVFEGNTLKDVWWKEGSSLKGTIYYEQV